MLRYHPDRAPRGREGEFLERAKAINAARDWMLSNPGSWRVETSVASPLEPQVMRRRASSVSYTVRSTPTTVASETAGPSRSWSPMRWVLWAVGIYFGVLLFAILGWLLTGPIPAILEILR